MARLGRGAAAQGEESVVECLGGASVQCVPAGGIVGEPLNGGELLEQLEALCRICGGYECAVGLAGGVFGVYQLGALGGHAPVAIAVAGHDAVARVFGQYVVHPPGYVGMSHVMGRAAGHVTLSV